MLQHCCLGECCRLASWLSSSCGSVPRDALEAWVLVDISAGGRHTARDSVFATESDMHFLLAAFAHDTGIDSGAYDNVFDNGSSGTQYIQSIQDLPAYGWTDAQPDDYCKADACTPITLAE